MLKFENVDIIKSLRAIMKTNTKNYQSDFNMDIKTLTKAVKKQNYEDKIYLWMSRPERTWCLQEEDTFIKGTWEYNTLCYYGENTQDKILVYAVEITGMEKRKQYCETLPVYPGIVQEAVFCESFPLNRDCKKSCVYKQKIFLDMN